MGFWKDWASYHKCDFCGGPTMFSWIEGNKMTFACLQSECLESLEGKTKIPDYIREAFKENENGTHIE